MANLVPTLNTGASSAPASDEGFITAFSNLLPDDPARRAATTAAIRDLNHLLTEQSSNFRLFVKACIAVQEASGQPSKKVAQAIAKAARAHYSESWFYRSIKAAGLIMAHPVLADVGDRERLAILARVPADKRETIFSSGRIDDANILTCDRAELRKAVRSLRHDAQQRPDASDAISAKLARRIAKISAIVPEDSKFAAVKQALAQAAQLLSQGQSA